jgi:hypothetical protein
MENRDEKIWALAQKRVAFKKELFTYIVINIFLWVLWLITKNDKPEAREIYNNIPWPAWVTLGWGVAVALKYFKVYKTTGDTLAEKEYEKLKNQQ